MTELPDPTNHAQGDTDRQVQHGSLVPIADGSASADSLVSEIGSLLHELGSVSSANVALPPVLDEETDNQLVRLRLGTAGSLFAALQCKHSATAGHALRVALTCSAWAVRMGLEQDRRDTVEIAALLHDIGVIGVPDQILMKSGLLDSDEAEIISHSRHKSLDILRHSCTSEEVLDIVEHVPAWYNGARPGFRLSNDDLPLGARMIAIVEAFDAMTTDHVYRSAMSHERAITELFDCAGTQFDLALVKQFAELHDSDQSELHLEVAGRWLQTLDPELVNSYWQFNCVPSTVESSSVDTMFQAKLLENMYDAVVFIDAGGQVTLWNRGAERLTGITGSSICQRQWHPKLLNMADEKGNIVGRDDCPVNCAISSGVQSLRRMTIWGRTERPVAVDTHTIPVISNDSTTLGAILLFHDASSETSLEQRCQNLHEKATKDLMTQVANRAEFDRVHEMFVAAHQQQQVPCSLIIGDLDRFKLVNDTWGHQAGDDVIKSLATLLKGSCRPGDLVARYGGEEFVMLCADCDNATAARRTEHIRKAFGQIPQPKMEGRTTKVSFGVTEIQPGDTAETMLRRADRALLMAKARGRNKVVQLGAGSGKETAESKMDSWSKKPGRAEKLIERVLVTPVPVKMTVEKLRGFVADHQAKIVKIDGNHVRLHITEKHPDRLRRTTDRPVTFRIDIYLEEERLGKINEPDAGSILRTKIRLSIDTAKSRDRRRSDVTERALDVLVSFQAYLMASDESEMPSASVLTRAKRVLIPWLVKR